MKPYVSMLLAFAAIALMAASPSLDKPAMTGCLYGQGPDEWLPGVATTTLAAATTAAPDGTPRTMDRRKTVALWVPSAAAGDCYATFDAATLTSTGARGFPLTRGADPRTVDIGPLAPLQVVCTAQLVTPNGLKIFQCR